MSPHLILLIVGLAVVGYLITRNDPELRTFIVGLLTKFLRWR